MVLLNEILPHIEEVSKIKLGNLTIVSTANAGETKINTFETLNKELLKPSLRIVKNNIPSFNPKNNLNKTKYHNPLYDILQTYKLLITTKV
jgi:hypothetical protein